MGETIHDIREWYIPGPVDVRHETLIAMAEPPYGHRTKKLSDKIKSIRENLFQIVNAVEGNNSLLLIGGSGTNALEVGARASATYMYRSVLVARVGAFGDLWREIFTSCGLPTDVYQVDDGNDIDVEELDKRLSYHKYHALAVTHNETSTGVMNNLETIADVARKYDVLFLVDGVSSVGGVPIDVTKLGIDYLATAPQKALGVPPGIGIAVASPRMLERAAKIEHRGYTTDILLYAEADKKDETLTTSPEGVINALDVQLNYIVNRQGIEARYANHRILADMTRQWAAREGFELFVKRGTPSDTVSCFSSRDGVDLKLLQQKLAEQGYGFDPGYRKLNDDLAKRGIAPTFRIAHMGDRREAQLERYLDTISSVLRGK